MSLPQKGHVQAEYVWIDAVGNCRCKTKVCIFLLLHSTHIVKGFWLSLDCQHDPMQLNALASPSAITRTRDHTCWLTHFFQRRLDPLEICLLR